MTIIRSLVTDNTAAVSLHVSIVEVTSADKTTVGTIQLRLGACPDLAVLTSPARRTGAGAIHGVTAGTIVTLTHLLTPLAIPTIGTLLLTLQSERVRT